jgi:hypothetical protein
MEIFFMLEIVMAKGRRLKKISDLEAHKQNVASSEQTIRKQNVVPSESTLGEQNVVPSKSTLGEQDVPPSTSTLGEQNLTSSNLKIDESSNLCGLELTMVTISHSNDEITPNTDWEFRPKNGALRCFGIYVN